MNSKTLIIILLIFVLIILLLNSDYMEDFANRNEKAQAIYNWFHIRMPNVNYRDYRAEFGGVSNIVEYEDTKRLFQSVPTSVEQIKTVLK